MKPGEVEKLKRKGGWYCPICGNFRYDDQQKHARRHQNLRVPRPSEKSTRTRRPCRHTFRSDKATMGWGRREGNVFTQTMEIVCIRCGLAFRPIELPARTIEPKPMLAYTDQFLNMHNKNEPVETIRPDNSQNLGVRELIVMVGRRDFKAAEGFLRTKFPTRTNRFGYFIVTARVLDAMTASAQLNDRGIPNRILGPYHGTDGHGMKPRLQTGVFGS